MEGSLVSSITDQLLRISPFTVESIKLDYATDSILLQPGNIVDKLRLYADSLRCMIKTDSLPDALVKDFFAENQLMQLEKVLFSASDEQKTILLASIRLNVIQSAGTLISALNSKIIPPPDFVTACVPGIDFKSSCARVGDDIEGTVYLTSYIPNTNRLKFFIDGKLLPNVNGMGQFQAVYHSAGLKNIDVEIQESYWQTDRFGTYNKQFNISVCQ